MENLKRIREPLAWTLVVLTGLSLAYQIFQLAGYVTSGVLVYQVGGGVTVQVGGDSRPGVDTTIGWLLNLQDVDTALLLALVAAVAGCHAAPTVPRARAIGQAAAWVVTLMVALPWVVVAVGLLVWPSATLTESGWDALALPSLLAALVDAGVAVVAVIALWALARRPPEVDEGDEEPDSDEDPDGAAELAEPDAAADENPAIWKPAEATGTVWRTADEAAAGAPGARSLEPGKVTSAGAEGTDQTIRPRPDPADDWRPSAGR